MVIHIVYVGCTVLSLSGFNFMCILKYYANENEIIVLQQELLFKRALCIVSKFVSVKHSDMNILFVENKNLREQK